MIVHLMASMQASLQQYDRMHRIECFLARVFPHTRPSTRCAAEPGVNARSGLSFWTTCGILHTCLITWPHDLMWTCEGWAWQASGDAHTDVRARAKMRVVGHLQCLHAPVVGDAHGV
jgi:hypothetical protein